ncbi:exocyst complex component 3-like [Dicentrarchus labrax]|uniref:exocyst complex component 3-like n=1 Tax=Dicentrarchus labrax TaxID=13489 RepID=UPI0021F5B150|nr:exocyst complex component 3-like [Dicentrarchus labrax]
MLKMWKFRACKSLRSDKKPLIRNSSNGKQEGHDQADDRNNNNPSTQNTFNTHEEQRLQSEVQLLPEITRHELAELLGVATDDSEDGSCFSGQQNLEQLMQRSVSQNFPKPPADLNQNLQQHLVNVLEAVRNDLVKLGPLLQTMGHMEYLIDCYHLQAFDHLSDLLQSVHSFQNTLVLMKWVLHTYLSSELLRHPELPVMDPVKTIDLLLYTEWVEKAKNKLLDNAQKEVRRSLEKILQIERSHDCCDCEEAYVGFYVDIIQCIDAMPKEAQKISSKLSDDVQKVCFQELLTFLQRYTTEQNDILGKQAEMDKPEMIHFFKTLTTCDELKKHVQTKSKSITRSLLQETVEQLEKMEAFTLKYIIEITADIAESHLKNYFKTQNKEFFILILGLQMYFPKLPWRHYEEALKRVMIEAYKLIVHIYLKHLVQRSQRNLVRCWSPTVGQTIIEDAVILHNTILEMVPDVQQWNLMLLKTPELLECKGIDAVKLTVAGMQKECPTWREDQDLLPALLRWKGLSGREVREVLDVLPGQEIRPRSGSWFSCLTCW